MLVNTNSMHICAKNNKLTIQLLQPHTQSNIMFKWLNHYFVHDYCIFLQIAIVYYQFTTAIFLHCGMLFRWALGLALLEWSLLYARQPTTTSMKVLYIVVKLFSTYFSSMARVFDVRWDWQIIEPYPLPDHRSSGSRVPPHAEHIFEGSRASGKCHLM